MIKESELIINNDGTVFHLHLLPNEIAKKIILVGDPGRVEKVASTFESIEVKKQNREFYSITGTYSGVRVTVLSTGIGTDNIDIVLNELDALVNIDFEKREIKNEHTSLDIMRIGTSGALQGNIPVDSFVVSHKSIGFDGLLNFYKNHDKICDAGFEEALRSQLNWDKKLPSPYVVNASAGLLKKFSPDLYIHGVNISAPGFYGPQGRVIRLPLTMPLINNKIENFNYNGFKVTNYEMESSAIYGLSQLLGHRAITVCAIIANRVTGQANNAYHPVMKKLIKTALNHFIS